MLPNPKLIMVGLLAAVVLVGCQNSNDDSSFISPDETDKLVITEYSDYQCPACAYFHPFVKKIRENMGDKVVFNLRYFPLSSHRYSALAARAAQAAKNQGEFMKMHSMLFERQKKWSTASNPSTTFVDMARELDLDINQFMDELNAEETQKVVMEQREEGIERGVNSTPTFFIDGEKLTPLPKTFEEFKAAIQEHLKQKG